MSVNAKNTPMMFNGDQVIMFTDSKKVKAFQGYVDTPSMEAWYKDDPTKNHLGLQKFFGNQRFKPQGIFPELLQNKSVLEVNGLGGKFTYDVPVEEDRGTYTMKDMSHQTNAGIDGSSFKIVLNKKFTAGDVLSNDPEYGQQIIVTEDEVMELGDTFEHTVKLVSDDKREWFLASNLAKGISYTKVSHNIYGEYGTNYSHVNMIDTIGKMRCEFQLGNVSGVEAYVTGKADSRSFSGATIETRQYVDELKREAEELGELAVMMDVKNGKSDPSTMRVGATMQFLVFRELERLTAQQLLFQRAATFRDSNGVTKLNEGLWHQLRRGKLIKYSRPNGITRNHIKEAVNYVFRNNPHIQPINRRIRFKCGSAAYENVIEIFQDEVRAQLQNLGQQGLLGSDRVLPENPVKGKSLMNLELSPVRFDKVYLPGIGNVELELDTNLDYNIMNTDRFSRGMHQYQRAHSTHSMLIWDVEDKKYSNNTELPEGAEVVEGGNKDSNIFLVKPKDHLMHWGYTNGRYSIHKSGDIVSSHKQIGQEFWAWNSVAIFVRDITKFVMIELEKSATKGFQ
jgi:hypothetical protein